MGYQDFLLRGKYIPCSSGRSFLFGNKLINKMFAAVVVTLSLGLLSSGAHAQSTATAASSNSSVPNNSSTSTQSTAPAPAASRFGMTYFLFFSGPGLDPNKREAPPNQLGNPDDDGLSVFNVVSLRYKLGSNLALDFQARGELFFNQRAGVASEKFNVYRWESPRIGISGKLLSGKDWNLTGAVNTDFPYMLPEPLTGYTSRGRQVIANPGMFANFSYKPNGSDWSIFAIVSPRLFVYGNKEAVTDQESAGGFNWKNKPEFILALSPTVNYSLTEKTSLSLGTTFDYRKQLGSTWNPLQGSLRSNGDSEAWRFMAMPISFGMTYEASKAFRIFPYIQAFPIAAQRINARTGSQASLLETASIGMWINGTVF